MLVIGILAGIWFQHHWPIGHLLGPKPNRPAPVEVSLNEVKALPSERRLVIVAVGQSNAANYVDTRASGGPGVYVVDQGRLYRAVDPLPGADGIGGSVWTRLGAVLVTSGACEAVVFGVVAQGSTPAKDWANGGPQATRLDSMLQHLQAMGLSPDFILWHQGESDALDADSSGRAYGATLRSIQARCRALAPRAIFVVARGTRHGDDPANAQIGVAQAMTASDPLFAAGPDLDALAGDYRTGGIHFNQRGAEAAAKAWYAALGPLLPRRSIALPPP